MSWMNYHHLYYFYIIAAEGSVSKAAERLRLGQPALSSQLKELEVAFGHQLFERANRKLHLTEIGKSVFEYAKEIFQLGNELQEVLKDQKPNQRVHLSIGALDSIPKKILNDLVESAYRKKDCFVSVFEGESDRLLRELQSHRVDLVMTHNPAPLAPQTLFRSRCVGEMKIAVCGSPKFRSLKKNFPESLHQQSFVLTISHSHLRREIEHYFETCGVKIQIIGETQDPEVQRHMAMTSLALIAVPLPIVSDEIKKGSLIEIGKIPNIVEQVWLTSAQRRIENPIARHLMDQFNI